MTIPFSVSDQSQECLIQLRDPYEGDVISEIFHGVCEPGTHEIEFDPTKIGDGLDAGLYVLYVQIGEEMESFPLQYMP